MLDHLMIKVVNVYTDPPLFTYSVVLFPCFLVAYFTICQKNLDKSDQFELFGAPTSPIAVVGTSTLS